MTGFDAESLKATLKDLSADPVVAGQMVSVSDDKKILATVANAVVPAKPKRKVPEIPKKGITIKFVNLLLPWVENYWVKHKRYPTTDSMIEEFGLSREEVLFINGQQMWLKCLDRRGIRRPNVAEDFLTPTQQAAISVMTNFHDRRHKDIKLASLGISHEEYNGWMSDPAFKAQMRARSDEILNNVDVDANMALANLIQKENFQAVKFYFEITGKAASPEAINVRQTMQILIEAVQKHVKDPSVLQAIAEEVNQIRAIQGVQ